MVTATYHRAEKPHDFGRQQLKRHMDHSIIDSVGEGLCSQWRSQLQTKVMITLFSLFADIESDLISMRTKEALAAARAAGVKLGRPKGR